MILNKKNIADRVIARLQASYPTIDMRWLRLPYVYIVVDDQANAMAKANYFQNWKLGWQGVDECFVTTWDGANGITVVDVDGDQSYIELPATPVSLPGNSGVLEVWPQNFAFGEVHLRQHADIRRTRKLMSGNMQGELGGCVKGTRFMFDQIGVGKKYSLKFNVRLVVKDSTAISETAPYPIAADLVDELVERAYLYLAGKRNEIQDTVRDGNDSPNRN